MSTREDALDEFEESQEPNSTLYRYQDGELVGGRAFDRQQADKEEQERLQNRGEVRSIDAKIGPLEFVGDFSDPDVNFSTSRETTEHNVVSGATEFGSEESFVVQPESKQPTEIEVVGWIREDQLKTADDLITENLVGVRTGRWIGTAVVEQVDIDYSRVYHDFHGPIFETTINLLSVRRGELPEEFKESLEPNSTLYAYRDGELVGGRAFDRQQEERAEKERLNNLFETTDISAVVGDLFFIDDFSDPDVQVQHSRETTDHGVVRGHSTYRDNGVDHVVQLLGRNPTELTIDGYIREDQIETADKLTEEDKIRVVTGRWIGTAVPLSVNIPYSRTMHNTHGAVFEITIDLLGIQQNELPQEED